MRSVSVSIFFGFIASLFFNLILNYGYITGGLAASLSVENPISFGILVALVSCLTTVLGLMVAHYAITAFLSAHPPTARMVISFTLFQIFAFIPLLTGSGNRTLTFVELIVSIISAFLIVRKMQTLPLTIARVNILAFIAAILFTYVSLSLARESGNAFPSYSAYCLFYSAFGLIPLVIITGCISYFLTSRRVATSGLVITMLPLTLFYIIGLLGFNW